MKKNKNIAFLIINILVPLLLGTLNYYFISPDVIFVKRIDTFIGNGIHFNNIDNKLWIIKFVRNYLLDMLWGYALVFALKLIFNNNAADTLKIFVIAVAFSAVMEILQITPIAQGTFDVLDILVEILAEVTAVFIIKKHFLEEVKEI